MLIRPPPFSYFVHVCFLQKQILYHSSFLFLGKGAYQ
nr:MAG TPA: hypothetical protein [Caudoviricetes sp.]